MENKVVSLNNVIFELYKAALCGEISQAEFVKVKSIIKRSKACTHEIKTDNMEAHND